MMENKYPYDNWKSITESDFVTLFIKTWFAFVSTLREMYPAEIPYYQATGDSRYISPYKRDFSQNIAYRLNYTDIKYHLYEVYKHGMKIIADRYPRFIVDDFYSLNLSFKETASEEFSLEGGFSGKFVCTVKCASAETLTATIMCTNKSYRTKVDKDYAPIGVSVDYSAILMAIVQEIEVEMSRNVQSGNTQNLKSSAAPVRLPAAPASTPGGNVKKCAVGKHPKSEKHGNTAQFSEVERSGTQENCGGIRSGCLLRLRPLPVLHRRQSQRVARIDPNAVVVDKNIAENDRFDLFSR